MSFEIGAESLPRRVRGSSNVAADYYDQGLGATVAIATAPWMVGLPKAGDSKDLTRIAYAKRDHDLALNGDVTALKNLQSQAVGAATAVGKAWYRAALADVQSVLSARQVATAPRVAIAPAVINAPNPIVQQATAMGLKIQPTSNGQVVAVNAAGAVVSSALPAGTPVTDNTVVPSNAVQANAPAPVKTPGVFSILDKLAQSLTSSSPASTSSDSFVTSQGAPVQQAAITPLVTTPDMGLSTLFQNPLILGAAALLIGVLFLSGKGGRH